MNGCDQHLHNRPWPGAQGCGAARIPTPGTAVGEAPAAAGASLRGTAGELVLVFYGRIALDSLELDGDRSLFDQLIAWDPEE
ncbi:hypothetical protein AMK16_26285 [Streptomyces sp. CB00455]|uniref:hypothetical protein n=1 Tax=Streptomyces sp. CB00455 TaxID=1703927 RepID=UPI000939889E|nr:hypothetical protein [Streptomyces sp. CB00455]OKK16204.1 hypothetical protein AMK16_26285 [Streptomyces sp. CB00455]